MTKKHRGWDGRLLDLVAFRRTHDTWPLYRDDDLPQTQLARWVYVQRSAARAGTLRADRLERLDDAVPGWRELEPVGD